MDVYTQENEVEDFLAGDNNEGNNLLLTHENIANDADGTEFKSETVLICENVLNGCELGYMKNTEKIDHKLRYRRFSLTNALKKRSIKCLNKMHIMEEVRSASELDGDHPHSPNEEEPSTLILDETSSLLQQNGDDSQCNGTDEDSKPILDKEIKVEDDCSISNHSGEKRKLEGDCEEPQLKKRIRSDLEKNFLMRDKILNEYIDSASCSSVPQAEYHMDQVLTEIKMLNELAREKEKEWNNIIHLKKIKEELLLRIQRRKQIMLINSDPEASLELQPDIIKNIKTGNGLMVFSTNSGRRTTNKNHINTYMELTNGFNNSKLNPQRPVLDVQSIIADYRQRHPEAVPRRGRRIRSLINSQGDKNAPIRFSNARPLEQGGIINFSSLSLGSGAQVQHNLNTAAIDTNGEMSIHLSASDHENQDISSIPTKPPPPYSEVTVHPVLPMPTQPSNSSLLHGILTKTSSKSENTKSSYSPTLARLLTAPERPVTDLPQAHNTSSAALSITDMLSNSKARNEITITPVGNQYEMTITDKGNNEEEVEDTTDRLVIDESETIEARNGLEELVDDVPQCQGCNQKAAQFVCAGCGNQWYCSRECQVVAWDEHSEVCSG